MKYPVHEVAGELAQMKELMPAIERMTAWVIARSKEQGIPLADVVLGIAEENQNPVKNNDPIYSLKLDPTGKRYLDAQHMIETAFQLYEAPNVVKFIEDAARCVCRPRTCSDPDIGCDLGKPIRDANQLLSGLYPMLKGRGEEAILDPERFLSSFIAAFFIFAQKSPYSIGKECTHFCESACTQSWIKDGALDGSVEISSMERTMELLGSLIGKTRDNPFGLYKYLFIPPSEELIAKNGHINVTVIGTGPASMQYAYRMRMNGYNVEMIEKESHERGGERVPNFGGTWFNGVPYNKRPKEELMRYFYLMQDMGIKMTVAEVGKDISVDEIRAKSDVIFNGAGLVGQPAGLRVTGENHKKIEHAMNLLQPFNEAVNAHVVAGGKREDFHILDLAKEHSGKTVVIVGAGYTEKDCTEWFAKLNHALKQAGEPEINVIVLERQARSIEGVRETHGGNWPKPAATLETELAAIIQGNIAGVDRKDAVVINKIEETAEGKVKLTLQVRKLAQASQIFLEKGERTYLPAQILEVEADLVVKALGFTPTRDKPSRLDFALGSVSTIQVKARGSDDLVDVQIVQVEDNRAKEPGVYYGGDNNTNDRARASGHATLVAAFADGEKAAQNTMRDIAAGIHKNPEAWRETREASSVAVKISYLRDEGARQQIAALAAGIGA